MSDAQSDAAAAYVAAFAGEGAGRYIANLETEVRLHRWGAHLMPLTVNNDSAGRTFVCSPRVGFIDFAREELVHFPSPALRLPLRALISAMELVLRPAQLERIVHVNNWMMSTNLPRKLEPGLASEQTQQLIEEYPTHILAMRSLNRRHSAPLMEALERAGWTLVPARQVFILDDVERQAFSTSDGKADARLWRKSQLRHEVLKQISSAEADQIIALYEGLYRQKYSKLNPAYTPDFVHLTHRLGLMTYHVLRNEADKICASGGFMSNGRHCAMPLLGYDLSAPRKDGLYRLICHAASCLAAQDRLSYNKSSGVGQFKRNRGASPEIEYTAFYVRHLSQRRRQPMRMLSFVGHRIGTPILQRYTL